MIEWIYGESGMGKTTLANRLVAGAGLKPPILLDGNEMREVWHGLTLSEKDRRTHNLRIARLARKLDMQGFNVVVATICPYEDLREEVQRITNCRFIHIESTQDKKSWK